MLNQETQDKISNLGFDVSKLSEAIKSDQEMSLDVPALFKEKGHTQEDMTVFGKNRFDEGKNAMSEIMAKSYKEKYGIDIEGKNLDTIVDAVKQKGFNEAKPEEGLVNAKKDMETLQGKYTLLEEEMQSRDNKHKGELFNSTVKQSLLSQVPNGTAIDASDLVELYLMKNQVVDNEGSAAVSVNGEIKKDTLLNAIPLSTDFKGWLDSKGHVSKGGMGGADSKGGGSVTKFKSVTEFKEYCKANNMQAMGAEGQKFLADNKASDFQYI